MASRQSIDVKELLKGEIGTRGIDNSFQIYNNNGQQHYIPRPIASPIPKFTDNPIATAHAMMSNQLMPYEMIDQMRLKKSEIGIEDHYFLLDSYYKTDDSVPSAGLYIYDLSLLNNVKVVYNVIEAEINDFTVPIIPKLAYQPDPFIARRLYVDIETIRAQQHIHGALNSTLRESHFDLSMETDSDAPGRMKCTRDHHTKYVFVIPIISLQKIYIRFKIPDRYVPFQNDTFGASPVASPGPSPANRQIATDTPHGLTGTANIYVVGFESTNNDLNNFMNNPAGHIVDVINATVLQFTLAPTVVEMLGTAISLTGGIVRMTVRIAERRIAFTLRLRSIIPKTTNFVSP